MPDIDPLKAAVDCYNHDETQDSAMARANPKSDRAAAAGHLDLVSHDSKEDSSMETNKQLAMNPRQPCLDNSYYNVDQLNLTNENILAGDGRIHALSPPSCLPVSEARQVDNVTQKKKLRIKKIIEREKRKRKIYDCDICEFKGKVLN